MLYELIAVVRPGSLHEVKEIAKTAGMLVLNSGGVVRGYTNWGTLLLPARARKHQAAYTHGHYFLMRFDSSARAQHAVRTTLGLDPRMVRFSVVRLGQRLDQIDAVGGKEWKFQMPA
ncbi:ribosomal protein S6 [Tirmania nivea]|nr:ribosomal protein S6 [Tirmania nivea]